MTDANSEHDGAVEPVVDLGEAREQRRPPGRATWEADLDDGAELAPAGAPVRVDSAELPPPTRWATASKRPIIPAWLRSGAEFRTVSGAVAKHHGHVGGYHLTRLPKYALRLAFRAPRGVGRAMGGTLRWMSDAEGLPVRLASVARADAEQYVKLSRQRDSRVRARTIAVLLGAGLLLAALVGLALAPVRTKWTVLVGLVALFGWVGSPADRPLIDAAVVAQRFRKLSADVVARAFTVAGLAKPDDPITFPQPIQRDGDGWRAVVDMPYGKTFTHALAKRDEIASGIDVLPQQVFLDRDTTSARRLALWVAGRDPLAVPAGRTPLLRAERVDFWAPFPIGVDERGNLVTVCLMWLSILVGAVPRQGKTFSARLLALAAALDPYVRLYVYDFKGSPDWRGFVKVAHRCEFGTVIDRDGDPVERVLADMAALKEEVGRRNARLSELPKDVCPEGKLTQQIAHNKSLNMPVVLVVLDEVQEGLTHPQHGKALLEMLTYLVKVGPSVGVHFLTSTQKPDERSCPPMFRDQHQARFCLRVTAWQVSDVILGAGAYTEGLDASRLLPSHKGVGIMRGLTDTGGIVRTHLADGDDADRILTRARALRMAAGTLTGTAAGESTEHAPAVSILDDVLAVVPAGEARVWSETVVARLAELRPDTYSGWGAEQLAAALKPHGIGTAQVWGATDAGKRANRRGITRDHITAAVTDRNRKRSAG
jgi:DNA segregation ATPase FtsK/SpoIIIE, S-DNA-T family